LCQTLSATDELRQLEKRKGESHMDAQALLDWQKLHDWAESKPKGSQVGIACTNSACPLANYLGEQTHKLWSVGPSIKVMDGTRDRLDKPGWIQELVERVDMTAANQSKAISREQFLLILADVKRVRDLETAQENLP
jgi:hypothetical protein